MISIDYLTNIIFVPKSYTQFVSLDPQTGLEVRQLNLTIFAQDLADLQDNTDGAWAPTAFEYTAPVNVGGVQLAPVVVILDPYTVEFEDDQYAVNLVGANTNVQDKVVVNQVSIRPNNSAGLTFSDTINIQSYIAASVWVDAIDGLPGTQFPRGTPSDPVSNVEDAVTIATRLNFHRFNIIGTFFATGNPGIDRYNIIGSNPAASIIIGTNLFVDNCSFERCAVVGSVTGRGSYQNCSIGKSLNFTGVEGIFDNCGIAGNITLDATATEPIIFKDCISAIAGLTKPILNCNGTAAGISFRRYAGGLSIINFNNVNGTLSLDLMGSEVIIDSSSCTAGELVVRGVGRVVDELGNDIAIGQSVINGGLTISNSVINPTQVQVTAATDNGAIAAAIWDYLRSNPTEVNSMKELLEKIGKTTNLIPATL